MIYFFWKPEPLPILSVCPMQSIMDTIHWLLLCGRNQNGPLYHTLVTGHHVRMLHFHYSYPASSLVWWVDGVQCSQLGQCIRQGQRLFGTRQ